MTPQAELKLLTDVAEINGKLDAQKVQLDKHEERDDERHDELKQAIEALQTWRERTRDAAEKTGRQEIARLEAQLEQQRAAEREAAREATKTARARRHDWIKSLAIVLVTMVMTLAGGAIAHAIGIK